MKKAVANFIQKTKKNYKYRLFLTRRTIILFLTRRTIYSICLIKESYDICITHSNQ